VQGDISQVDTAQRAVDEAIGRFGRIDSLINNAGLFIAKPFDEYTPDDFAAVTSVNLAGFFHITQRAVRAMLVQGNGHIVNISTSLVDHANSHALAALASLTKGGLAAVTRGWSSAVGRLSDAGCSCSFRVGAAPRSTPGRSRAACA
jgi:NAD(P)-dependent dehydrogenase (short-subunit alcohol dehydrogenase family)